MEQLNEKGLHLDDLQRLRVLEPDSVDQVRQTENFKPVINKQNIKSIQRDI